MTVCAKARIRRKPKSLGRLDEALWKRFCARARENGRYVYAYLEEALQEKLDRDREKDC